MLKSITTRVLVCLLCNEGRYTIDTYISVALVNKSCIVDPCGMWKVPETRTATKGMVIDLAIALAWLQVEILHFLMVGYPLPFWNQYAEWYVLLSTSYIKGVWEVHFILSGHYIDTRPRYKVLI